MKTHVFKLLCITVMLLMAMPIVILEKNILSPISFCDMNALRLNVHKSNAISEEKTICANGSIDFTIPTMGTFYHL